MNLLLLCKLEDICNNITATPLADYDMLNDYIREQATLDNVDDIANVVNDQIRIFWLDRVSTRASKAEYMHDILFAYLDTLSPKIFFSQFNAR